MRCLLEYKPATKRYDIPVLRLFAFGAPHRRAHRKLLELYRKELYKAAKNSGIQTPIKHNVELLVTFIDPTSPDLDNLLVATFQALDGKCGKGPTVLADDELICYLRGAGIIFTEGNRR
jgi:hypothetical protein